MQHLQSIPTGEWISLADQEQHRMVMRQQQDAQAVAVAWSRLLTIRYQLMTGDAVEEDGRIVRGAGDDGDTKPIPITDQGG
jgi:hypothetical protein